MKFDKIMNICYRVFCILLSIVVIGGFAVSCFRAPLSACADELDILTSIFAYEDTFRENLITVNQNVSDALNDSSLSDETKTKIRTVLALQELVLRTMPDIYGNPTNPILPDSDTVTFSGSGATGVFYDNTHKLHSGTVFQGSSMSGTLFTSDLFTISYGFYSNSTDLLDSSLYACSPYSYTSGISCYTGVQCNKIGGGSFYPYRRTFASSSYLTTLSASFYNGSVSSANVSVPRYLDNSYPPTILPATNVCGICAGNVYEGASGYTKLLGYSSAVSLPSASVDTDTPWNYYNNTLLPYIRSNYSDVNNIYIAFPNGYFVPVPPDPTEPATFPNGGIYIDKQYNIGINIIYPTDENGQPITDASGETVTETQYITDTSPLDGEYSFQMPTLPRLNIYDATLPSPDVSAYSDGIGFIWNACYNILTDTGFMPVVMICFALSLFGFILWKLGG